MNSNTPPQDSDAEIDEIFVDVAVRSANQYGGFEEWETPEEREEVIGKAKQALLALKSRWEAQIRIDEAKHIRENIESLGTPVYLALQRIDGHIDALQNQLPSKVKGEI